MGAVTTEWPEDRAELIRLERELSQVRQELQVKSRELEVADRQIADLKGLFIKLREVPVPEGAPDISDYYDS